MPLAERILKVFEEGLGAWKTFIATRQEAYNRKKDKQQEKAINIAEETYEEISKLFEILAGIPLDEEAKKDIDKSKITIYRLKTKFNKYD